MALFIALPLDLHTVAAIRFIGIRLQRRLVPRLMIVAGRGEQRVERNEKSITLPFEIPRYKGHDLETCFAAVQVQV